MNQDPSLLTALGWSHFFQQQLTLEEWQTRHPVRVAALNRHLVEVAGTEGASRVCLPPEWLNRDAAELPTVGDWLLLDQDQQPVRMLERKSLFKRMASGLDARIQLMAANVDTLFVVSSCNQDFNLSRLERYLAMALDAGVEPVLVLTKMDLAARVDSYLVQAARLHPELSVVTVNAREGQAADRLKFWLGHGQTVALVGSSGVGKSTLVNTLSCAQIQDVAEIRTTDAKGRHTTTGRTLHLLPGGGLLIDSPGLRELQLSDCASGLASLFDEIEVRARQCRFTDCRHQGEPGCAVVEAAQRGELDPRRLANYLKLRVEQQRTSETLVEKRRKDKSFGKMTKRVQAQKQREKY